MNDQNINNKILNQFNRASGSLTRQDLQDAYTFFDGKCPYSETPIDPKDWHLEHIIPVKMGGTTDAWNCIPVCGPCNLSKGGKHLLDWWDETHKPEEEYKLEKIFIYILNSLNKPRNYQITTIEDEEINKLIQEEQRIEEQQEYEDETYIETTKKLDTFTFLYQIINHLNHNKNYIVGDFEKYKKVLNDTYNQNKEYVKIDVEVFKLQNDLTNYLKSIKVIKHYSIAYEFLSDINSIEEIKNNVNNISEYLKNENISDLINKNPKILFMDVEEFSSKLEYIVNVLNIPLKIILKKPNLLNEIEFAKEFYETCKNVGFDINNMTNSSFERGNLKRFVKILKSKEFKEHPDLFTSQVLARSTPERIAEIIASKEFKEHPDLFTSTTLAQSTPERISDILSMPEWNEEKYKHLLQTSILRKSKDKISLNIKVAEEFGIEEYISISYLIKSPSQNYALINYLIDNNINLIDNGKLNSVFSYQPGVILKKYGIDLKKLTKMYPYEEGKDKNAVR